MLSFAAFGALPDNQQAGILWLDGVFMELMRSTPKFNVELYSLYGFYVEMFFDPGGEPLFMKCFEGGSRLEPYLEMIPLNDVLESI
jgi:hypothetical protein